MIQIEKLAYYTIYIVAMISLYMFVVVRATMTHAAVPKEERDAQGVTENLIRLSVGIEDIEDLIADVDQALIKAVDV